jgi:hypothetical protein
VRRFGGILSKMLVVYSLGMKDKSSVVVRCQRGMLYMGRRYHELETDWTSLYRQFFRALVSTAH